MNGLKIIIANGDYEMLRSNDDNYYRARAMDFINAETVNKELLEANMMQRRNSIEAMRQRYTTMQRLPEIITHSTSPINATTAPAVSITPYWQLNTAKWKPSTAKEPIINHGPGSGTQSGY